MSSANSVEEFLAREQEQLAGIDDDGFGGFTGTGETTPVNGSDERPALESHPIEQEKNLFDTTVQTESVNGGSPMDITVFGSPPNTTPSAAQNSMYGTPQQETDSQTIPNSISGLPLQQQTAMRRAVSPTPPPAREEPPKMKAWREQQKERLDKKDSTEKDEMEKLRQQAKRELDDWYKKRQEQLDKTMKHNRTMEEELLQSQDSGELLQSQDSGESGQSWERIAGYCDFASKSARGGTKDMSRFRGILLQMKNKPPKAASK